MILGKRYLQLNGFDFYQMIVAGAQSLERSVAAVNALNVFPVPDGDTGTNMDLTFKSGITELQSKQNHHIGIAAEVFSKGLLLGARGNSGVILSQLFRGFAQSIHNLEQINTQQFAAAIQSGVSLAYKAVMKPVEGTILTVAKEIAQHAVKKAIHTDDFAMLLQEMLQIGKQTLALTPELLPILKQVGVVDAGGEGLLIIYTGFIHFFTGIETAYADSAVVNAQAKLTHESIEYGYCTEFFIKLHNDQISCFKETVFRRYLVKYGDSVMVVSDGSLIKIHIHTENPHKVMRYAMKYGQLLNVHIENMREQHLQLMAKSNGIVAVCSGAGVEAIFYSLGVDKVVGGGQTMNPSTEEIVQATKQVNAKNIFILPNHANVILAAEQASSLFNDRNLIVIPSKTIPQGIAAMLAFQVEGDTERNKHRMSNALANVESGLVTYAVRDTNMGDFQIKQGDFIGIHNEKIVAADPDVIIVLLSLIKFMLVNGGDIMTIIVGQEAKPEQTEQMISHIRNEYAAIELEVHHGGQPVYPYIFSVE